MLEFIIICTVGILFSILGYLVMVKKKINLIHDYHLKGVKDTKNYCNWMGGCIFILGIIFIGFSILGFIQIITFTQIRLILLIICIIDIMTLLIIQKKFAGHIL